MAGREKAILDFLYLYDFYNTGEEISEIRFNETVLESEIDWEKMDNYLERFNNKALTKRIGLIREIYKI
jgi:predicted transcriptional regulator of viral defense system